AIAENQSFMAVISPDLIRLERASIYTCRPQEQLNSCFQAKRLQESGLPYFDTVSQTVIASGVRDSPNKKDYGEKWYVFNHSNKGRGRRRTIRCPNGCTSHVWPTACRLHVDVG